MFDSLSAPSHRLISHGNEGARRSPDFQNITIVGSRLRKEEQNEVLHDCFRHASAIGAGAGR